MMALIMCESSMYRHDTGMVPAWYWHYSEAVMVLQQMCKWVFFMFYDPLGEWAGPGGTAIPGQPVAKAEQAPDTSPSSKNQFNIVVPRWGTYQILS